MSSPQQIRDEAAQWLAREDSGNWSDVDRLARDAWLDVSPTNRVAYLRLEAAWKRTERLAALQSADIPAGKGAPRPRSWPLMAAGLLVAFLAGAGSVTWLLLPPKGLYQTAIGAHETIHLADGSTLELNTDTRLRAVVNDARRQVVLEKGEAFFQVVHNPSRPFVVIAGSKRIIDVGTKFSVRKDGDKVSVVVTEGRVQFEDAKPPNQGSVAQKVVLMLDRGDRAVATPLETLVAERTPQQISDELGWRNGLLIFSHEDLGEAAMEFNRYNQKKIVIEGGAIAHTRIGGRFQAANVDAFAKLLQDGFGFKVSDQGQTLKISQ